MAKLRKGAKLSSATKEGGPPAPFERPPQVLRPLIDTLDEKHVYIFHIDSMPQSFKRNIFLVPVLTNITLAILCLWRLSRILPWYLRVFESTIGIANETTLIASQMSYEELARQIIRRAGTFMLDLGLCLYVWPWPWEFAMGQQHGNPVMWRWNIGFRDREVVVRRSTQWDQAVAKGDVVADAETKSLALAKVKPVTTAMFLAQKTGYLTINLDWTLDWGVMVDANTMVDRKMVTIDAFKLVVLIHHGEYGWMALETGSEVGNDQDDDRTRQVLNFRDALAAIGKEDLFFRWIEIVEFEASQPGGFGPEKQSKAARQVRELFRHEKLDFDKFWEESVGSSSSAGL